MCCLTRSITCKYSADLSIRARDTSNGTKPGGDPSLEKGPNPPFLLSNATSSLLSGEGEGSSLFVSMELNGLTYQGILFQKGPTSS